MSPSFCESPEMLQLEAGSPRWPEAPGGWQKGPQGHLLLASGAASCFVLRVEASLGLISPQLTFLTLVILYWLLPSNNMI